MKNEKECCGTCRWHRWNAADQDWVCMNDLSECCADWTGYGDSCNEWEERR